MPHHKTIALAITLALAVAACAARKQYPDPDIGWHSADYSVIFGRIQRIPGRTADDPVTWTIRFGDPGDDSAGEFALDPPERMVGYTGGERVEIHGHRRTEPTNDNYNGRWYIVDSIRMWYGHR